MNARLTVLLMAVLAAAVLAAGCGGSDSDAESVDTTLTASSLSKPEFIKRANVICYREKTENAREYFDYQQENPNLPRFNIGTEGINTIFVPSVEKQLVELRELGAPAGDVEQIEAMWGGLERSLRLIEEGGISAAPAIRRTFLPNGRRIYDYGMDGCAYGL